MAVPNDVTHRDIYLPVPICRSSLKPHPPRYISFFIRPVGVKMSRFTAINQNKLHRMDAGGDASAPQMNYCPSPTAGKKRKRTQLQAGSTSAKKNTSQDSKANPISRTSKSRNSASDVSQGLKVSKPIPRMTVKSSQEIPPSGTFLWENISHMKTDATSMSENHLGPHSPLTSTAISLNGGKEGEGRNRAGKGDRVFIDASGESILNQAVVLS